MKATPVLRDSQFLAEFVNLDVCDPGRVEEFRHQHPDFAPSAWWDYEPSEWWHYKDQPTTIRRQWRSTQILVKEAWENQFKSDGDGLRGFIRLFLLVFDPNRIGNVRFGLTHHPALADLDALDKEYGYHKAIRYLFDVPWRARFCEECGAAYVADHNKRKYCSVAGEDGLNCSAKVIERTHIEWGRANNWGRKTTKV